MGGSTPTSTGNSGKTPSRLVPHIRLALLAGAAASAFGSLASVGWLAYLSGGGRIRETGYFQLGAIPIRLGRNIYRDLPYGLSAYHEIASVTDGLRFASEIFLANVSVTLVLTAIVVLVGYRLRPVRRLLDQGATLPLGVYCTVAYPLIYTAARTALAHVVADATDRSIVAALGALALTFGAFLWGRKRTAAGWGAAAMDRVTRAGLGLGAAFLLATTILQVEAASAVHPAAGPNVLLISVDSLRADHLSSYGYARKTSPHIDQLAEQGVRFAVNVVTAPWTLPSHMSLLTGLDALGHGVWQTGRRLAPGVPTLTEALKANGYATYGVVAGPFLNASRGFGRGFDYYDDFTVGRLGGGADHRQVTSPLVVAAAERWLRDWNNGSRDRPFFLFVHFWDVHYDYRPPPPYNRAFDTGYSGSVSPTNFERNGSINANMDPDALAFVVSQYDGEILYTDSHIGRLIDTLDRAGELNNTLVVVTADHGDEFFEHGRKGHRAGLNDEVMLTPLIMRWPRRIKANTVVERQVRLIDVAPTILQYVGVDPAWLAGADDSAYSARDLSPVIDDRARVEMPRLAFMDLHGGERQGIRTGDRKFIAEPKGVSELYDLQHDSRESENLAYRRADELAKFRQLLRGWVEARESVTADHASQTEEQLEILRSLGYIQ